MFEEDTTKKVWEGKCAIDICQYENGVFCVKGWMFSDKRKMQRMQLVVEVGRVKYPVDISSDS